MIGAGEGAAGGKASVSSIVAAGYTLERKAKQYIHAFVTAYDNTASHNKLIIHSSFCPSLFSRNLAVCQSRIMVSYPALYRKVPQVDDCFKVHERRCLQEYFTNKYWQYLPAYIPHGQRRNKVSGCALALPKNEQSFGKKKRVAYKSVKKGSPHCVIVKAKEKKKNSRKLSHQVAESEGCSWQSWKESVLSGSHFVFSVGSHINQEIDNSCDNKWPNEICLSKVTTEDLTSKYAEGNISKKEIVAYKKSSQARWIIENKALHQEWVNISKKSKWLILYVGECRDSVSMSIQMRAKIQNDYRRYLDTTDVHLVSILWGNPKKASRSKEEKERNEAKNAMALVKNVLCMVQNHAGNKVGLEYAQREAIWYGVVADGQWQPPVKLDCLLLLPEQISSLVSQGRQDSMLRGLTNHLFRCQTSHACALYCSGGYLLEDLWNANEINFKDEALCRLDGHTAILRSGSVASRKICELLLEYCPDVTFSL